jgi:hypothetical protein
MFPRSWFAVLLFVNYLLVVGGGYMNAPGEPRYAITNTDEHRLHCSHCHHVDITPFLEEVNEQLATELAENNRKASEHHVQLLKLMDVHCLPNEGIQPEPTVLYWERIQGSAYRLARSEGVCAAPFSPPWQG